MTTSTFVMYSLERVPTLGAPLPEEIDLLPKPERLHGCKVANGYEYSPLSRSSLAGPSFQAEVRGHCRPSRCKTLIRSDAVHDRRYLS